MSAQAMQTFFQIQPSLPRTERDTPLPSLSHCTHVKGQVYFVEYRRDHVTSSSGFIAPLATAVPKVLVHDCYHNGRRPVHYMLKHYSLNITAPSPAVVDRIRGRESVATAGVGVCQKKASVRAVTQYPLEPVAGSLRCITYPMHLPSLIPTR